MTWLGASLIFTAGMAFGAWISERAAEAIDREFMQDLDQALDDGDDLGEAS